MTAPSLATRSIRIAEKIARIVYTGRDAETKRHLKALQLYAKRLGAQFVADDSHAQRYEALFKLIAGNRSDASISANAERYGGGCIPLLVAAVRGQLKCEEVAT